MAALAITALGLMVCAFALKFAVFPNDQWAQYSQPVRQAMHTVTQSVWDDGGSGGSLWGTGKQNARIKHPPVAAPDEQVVMARCGATRGNWCGRYDNQTPLPARAPPLGNQSCLWGDDLALQCNFVGVCDGIKGWCRCPAGWTGDDCSRRMRRPCSQNHRSFGFEPYDRPTDPSLGGTTLACADLCDEDIAHCYCNSTYPHGRIPADPEKPPGAPPIRKGRPISHQCRRGFGFDGKKSDFGTNSLDALYGEKGWCVADEPEHTCPCLLDGQHGPTCQGVHESFCPNQCNGHGECLLGFCKCQPGWFGTDCAQRMAGIPWSPGMEDGERPWLKPFVHTPAALEPAENATRKRPLIYVYDLPPMYNAIMLQYRVDFSSCVHRQFNEQNGSYPIDSWLYQPETGLHEMLLQSEHRTLDPEEADYFYLPIYTSCLIFPVLFSNDSPYFHGGPAAGRTHGATNMLMEVQKWVATHHPYWDRNGGRDHIVLTVHDEGSCWLPAVLRPAIVLSHWGRTEVNPPAGSGYGPDNYSFEVMHPVYQPEGHLSKLGSFPCYDPSKDMIIPLMSSPNKYHASPLLGAPTYKRHILAFFNGRIQPEIVNYSRGTRQFLANHSAAHDWWGKHRIHIGNGGPPGEVGDYSVSMASSIFCLALMGDGYSSRFDDAVLHGCIPVIIQDGIELTWHSLLDLPSYSMRIAQKDMQKIPEILAAVSEEQVARMQANLALVWRRHIWTGYRPYGQQVRQLLEERRNKTNAAPLLSQPPPATDYNPGEDDALSTLMQWLYSRLDDLGAHAPASPSPAAAAATKAAGQRRQR
ncbi:hypothetical protein D9Q98_003856 [Chlorella vulgaris]|uniref:EGF-like domain-containing protein n=1 Tax=Chlorella vulgaris TaxID=3077 RepID=A0A9D4YY01_CHLVU|nr:hypothetical protein D9Q98_003856 [Chlorella vulgaris]